MKSFLILVVTLLLFASGTFFYLYLYDVCIIAFGRLVTFLMITSAIYIYISLLIVIDKSKKLL
jgi:hypothetical protein